MIKILFYFFYFYSLRVCLRLIGYNKSIYLAERFSFVLAFLFHNKLNLIHNNLAACFGNFLSSKDIKAISEKIMKNIAKNSVNLLFFDKIPRNKCASISSFSGIENIEQAINRGKGAILLSGHSGSIILALHSLGMTTNYKPHVYISQNFNTNMTALNHLFAQKTVSLYRAGSFKIYQNDLKGIFAALKANRIVGIAFDAVKAKKFLKIPFGKYKILISEGPFQIAKRTGASIIPFFSSYLNGQNIEVIIGEPINVVDIHEAASCFMGEFESFLLTHPQDWGAWARLTLKNSSEGPVFELIGGRLI